MYIYIKGDSGAERAAPPACPGRPRSLHPARAAAAPNPPFPQKPRKALTAGARRARSLCGPLTGRRQEMRGGEGRAALSLPALRLQQPARLPRAPPRTAAAPPRLALPCPALPSARGCGCPAGGRGIPAAAAWARGEGPSAASSSPALREGVAAHGGPSPGLRRWRNQTRYRRPTAHAWGPAPPPAQLIVVFSCLAVVSSQ